MAKGKPHTAKQRRHVLTEDFRKMGISVVPWVDKRSALTIRIAPCFFLVGTLQFGMKGLFAYIPHGKIIGGDFFLFTVGRTLTFCRRHNERIDWGKCMKEFEGEGTVKKGKGRKCLC